jgi:hypothetical protein
VTAVVQPGEEIVAPGTAARPIVGSVARPVPLMEPPPQVKALLVVVPASAELPLLLLLHAGSETREARETRARRTGACCMGGDAIVAHRAKGRRGPRAGARRGSAAWREAFRGSVAIVRGRDVRGVDRVVH